MSLAWLVDPTTDPTPLLTSDHTTIVVVWPTDLRGRVQAAQLHAARVLRWSVSTALLDQLREVHAEWPLASHDLLFGGQPVSVRPCARSLLNAVGARYPVMARRLAAERDAHIAALTGQLEGEATSA